MTLHGLSPSEETEASRTWVHLIWYVYVETDETGEEVAWGIPLSIHFDPQEAGAEASRRKGAPPPGTAADGNYHVEGPCNLFALACTGFIEERMLREGLTTRRKWDLVPTRWYSPSRYRKSLSTPPLTSEECRDAARANVWFVYYEDQFHGGDARDSFPVAICLSEAEARAEVARRGPLTIGYDGYLMVGPTPLVREEERTSEMGAGAIREALRRLKSGEPGPVTG